MAAQVMSGARASLGFATSDGGSPTKCGIFKNVSWSLTYQAEPVFILGKHAAAEIEYTSQDVVHITASGWRIIDHGPHVTGRIPALKDLLSHEYLFLSIEDRQSKKRIAYFKNVRPTGYSTSMDARQLEEITVNFVGIYVDDENTDNSERADAMTLLKT